MDIKFSRAVQTSWKASGPCPLHPSLQKTGREAFGRRDGEYRGSSPMADMSTHCITERVRLAARASAMDLAPSSLIVLL